MKTYGLNNAERMERTLLAKYPDGNLPEDERLGWVMTTCPECLEEGQVFILTSDHQKLVEGQGFIQNILFYLTAEEREMLITGLCGPCYDKITRLPWED